MSQWLGVTSVFVLLLSVESRFVGDSCRNDGKSGECRLLANCRPLLAEINRAGTPMPAYIRRKLQKLMCGFDSDEPIFDWVYFQVPTWKYTHQWDHPMEPYQDLMMESQGNRENSSKIVCCPSEDYQTTEKLTPLFTVAHGLGIPLHNWDDTIQNWGSPTSTSTRRPSWNTGNDRTTTGKPSWNSGNDRTTSRRPSWNIGNDRTTTRRPSWNNSNDKSTTRKPSWNSDNDRTNNKNGNEEAVDVRSHRNFRLLPTDCGVIEDDRIWGGNRTRLFEMPWMVLIAYNSARGTKLSCGGTLIHERYVLTAAHCVSFLGERLKLSGVILGEYDVRTDPDCERVEGERICASGTRNVSIDTIIPHPGYSPQNLFDDIALLRLSEPADFSQDNMKPVCLPSIPELQADSMMGKQVVVTGWGATEDGLQSPVLLSVALPAVSNRDCQAAYNGSPHIYNRQMCAGGVPDKDSCGGDSGGPLLHPGQVPRVGLRYVQRGIVSYGSKRCGVGGFPGVYTRVGHYMDWILDNMRD